MRNTAAPARAYVELDELRALVADLAARVEQLERAQVRLSRADRRALQQLLPVLVGRYGSEIFTARDLALDAAPAMRIVIGTRSPKSLGRLLARAAEAGPIDGVLVERDAQLQVNVSGWRVVGSSVSSHEKPTPTDRASRE